jgi:FLVCR family MFS transporter 7
MNEQLIPSRVDSSSNTITSAAVDAENTFSSSSAAQYTAYPIRWVVLLFYGLLTIANAILWITFATIADISATYFSVDSTRINMLSIVYMITYPPGYILATWIFDKYGLRKGLLFGAVVQAGGAWLRYFSTSGDSNSSSNAYIYLIIGQTVSGLVQPIYTNSPTKVAADWFSGEQRNLATTIGAMCNPLGIAIGQLLPSLIVGKNSGMPLCLIIEASFVTVVGVGAFIFLHNSPPSPPSAAAALKLQLKAANQAQHIDRMSAISVVISEIRQLMANKHFRILTLGVAVGLGMFNALSTLLERLVTPAGYSSDDAGIFGALLILVGFIGAGIVGPIMDKTHKYNKILKLGIVLSGCGLVFMFTMIRPNSFGLLVFAWGVLGFFILPLLPVCMECGVECTYPVSEDSSSGFLILSGNVFGVGIIFLMDYLIDLQPKYSTILTPVALFCCSLMIFAAVTLIGFYNGPTLRSDAEMRNKNNNNNSESAPGRHRESSITVHGQEPDATTNGSNIQVYPRVTLD